MPLDFSKVVNNWGVLHSSVPKRTLNRISRQDFSNFSRDKSQVEFSVAFVIPVHDNGHSIEQALDALYSNTVLPFRLIIVLDSCNDRSPEVVFRWVSSVILRKSRAVSISVVTSKRMLHETMSDNIGFSLLPECEIIVEVQADIIIQEKNFDRKIQKVFNAFPDIVAISGRGTHLWTDNYNPELSFGILKQIFKDIFSRQFGLISQKEEVHSKTLVLDRIKFFSEDNFGRLGVYTESKPKMAVESRQIYLSETVMRGPLAFRNSSLVAHGFLNSRAHPLAFDDHEFFLRAWKQSGMRTCYLPINYDSPLSYGNDRRRKPWKDEIFVLWLRVKMWLHKGESELYLSKGFSEFEHPIREIRMVDFKEFEEGI